MDDVRGLFLGMPHGKTPAAVTTNKNIIMRPVNTNVLRSASPKIALVSASRYNCHIYNYMLLSVPSFIRIERGLDGGL